MEWEEIASQWEKLSLQLEAQKKVTGTLILKMTRSDYRSKLSRVVFPEVIGSLFCLIELVYLLLHFRMLNTWYLVLCGVVTALILLVLPMLSLTALRKMVTVPVSSGNVRQSLVAYSKNKKFWVFTQKTSFYLGAILLLTILPVAGQIFALTDMFVNTKLWYWYILAYPFFYFLSRWIFKSYNSTLADAENILKELED